MSIERLPLKFTLWKACADFMKKCEKDGAEHQDAVVEMNMALLEVLAVQNMVRINEGGHKDAKKFLAKALGDIWDEVKANHDKIKDRDGMAIQ